MSDEHREADKAAEQREGHQKAEEVALIDDAHRIVEAEGHAAEHIADRHAEDHRRDEAADEEAPVPEGAPARLGQLGAILEPDRPQDDGDQDHHHRQIEAGERGGIECRPGGEDRAAAEDQPDLIAFPDRADRVDHDAPLVVVLGDEGQEGRDPEVEAVHDREADQENAEQQPPDQAERLIVEGNEGDHGSVPHHLICGSAATAAGKTPAPCGSERSGPAGPFLIACSIR